MSVSGPTSVLYQVTLITEGFVERPIQSERYSIIPLRLVDASHRDAIRGYLTAMGATVTRAERAFTFPMDAVAITSGWEATSAEEAIALGRDALERLAQAVTIRNLRAGRRLGFFAARPDGTDGYALHDLVRTMEAHYGPDDDAAGTIDGIEAALAVSEQAGLLARMFEEALAERSADGAIVRLWAILEMLSDGVPDPEPDHRKGAKLRIVRAAMTLLALADRVDLASAYRIRNDFVHDGVRARPGVSEPQRTGLIGTVFLALMRSGFRPVDPARPPFDETAVTTVRTVELRPPPDIDGAVRVAPPASE